jgi:hypothetical protein
MEFRINSINSIRLKYSKNLKKQTNNWNTYNSCLSRRRESTKAVQAGPMMRSMPQLISQLTIMGNCFSYISRRNYDDGWCAICLHSHVTKSPLKCGQDVFCYRCLVDCWCRNCRIKLRNPYYPTCNKTIFKILSPDYWLTWKCKVLSSLPNESSLCSRLK